MKTHVTLLYLTAIGSVGAFGLRLFQNLSGFEPDTGLPIPGFPGSLLLVAVLFLLAIGLVFLTRRLPESNSESSSFPKIFLVQDSKSLLLPILGIFLLAAAGLADLYESLGMGKLWVQLQSAADPYASIVTEVPGFPPRFQLLLGILSLASSGALFLIVAACRKHPGSFDGTLLLLPPVMFVVRLVLTYRLDSVNPSLEAYYVELLALIFLSLGFYRLSSFAFGAGKHRPFIGYTCAAAILCCAALADGGPHLSSLLLYVGGGTTLMGFTLSLLSEKNRA